MRARHSNGHRKTGQPVKLTERQEAYKSLFCLLACVASATLSVWAGMWLLAGLAAGALSLLHLVLFLIGLLMAVVFGDIASGETEEGDGE